MSKTMTLSDRALVRKIRVSDEHFLSGELYVPENARGIVLFAHGSGSSRLSPRNQFVARAIQGMGVGTLLFDLLTEQEEELDRRTAELRFNIDLLATRLIDTTLWIDRVRDWIANEIPVRHLRVGYFGASTGAAAALVAASSLTDRVGAIVSRGGRPDLAGDALSQVTAPTLLVVGGHDDEVLKLNWEAYAQLKCEKDFRVVMGATHLFEERGALAEVARVAAAWFRKHLQQFN